MVFILLISLQLLTCTFALTVEDLQAKFERDGCIEVSQLSMEGPVKTSSYDSLTKITDDKLESVDFYASKTEEYTASPPSLINEVAQLNEINYYYFLVSEEGPPHNRIFKMSLQLNDEVYHGEGSSLKAAKTAAAKEALKNTKYAIPVRKPKDGDTQLTPTVKLNNLATKLGMKVTYVLLNDMPTEDEEIQDYSYSKVQSPEIKPYKSYMSKLNHSIYHPYKTKYTTIKNDSSNQPQFIVAVHVGDKQYIGTGFTIQSARHDGAAKAIEGLKQLSAEQAQKCLAEGVTCNANNVKSPISLVYETATMRGVSASFEVISETGPAHEREFVTKCQVGDLTTEGTGRSKKVSKRSSAEKMLKQLESTGSIADTVSINNLNPDKNKKKKKKKKQKNVVKNKVQKFVKDAQNFVSSAFDHLVDDSTVQRENKYSFDKNVNDESSSKSNRKLRPSADAKENVEANNYKEHLLDLTQQKNMHVEFTDLFAKESKHISYLLLGIHPPYICLGNGESFSFAHEKASMEALDFLHKIGMDAVILSKEMFEDIHEDNLENIYISDVLHDKES